MSENRPEATPQSPAEAPAGPNGVQAMAETEQTAAQASSAVFETPATGVSGARIKIAWKITSVVVLVMLVLAVVNILFIRGRFSSVMANEFQSRAKAIAFSLASSSEDKLLSGNVEVIQSMVDGFRGIHGVRYVYVANDTGQVVAHTFDEGFPQAIAGLNQPEGDAEFSITKFDNPGVGQVLEVAAPILFGVAGVAHVGMDSGLITGEMSTITSRLIIQFAIASILGILLLHLVVTYILRHMKTLFAVLEKVGHGDLTARVVVPTSDEFQVLGDHLNETFLQLGKLITMVRNSYGRIALANERIVNVYKDVLEGMEQEAGLASETMGSVQDNKRMIDEVTQGIHVLESSANDSFSSIMEMGASIEEVSSMSDSLFQSVGESNSAIENLSGSIDQISENLVALSKASDETASAMNEMSASIVQVRGNAESTSEDAIKMTRVAEDGSRISRNAMEGILAIRESSQQVEQLVDVLTERIEEIDDILSFITDITGKTNLLALNAAIIAAQAGAQGKGFGVVADEINELAQNTKAQTNRIAQVIEGLREEVQKTSDAVGASNRKVDEGVELAEGVTAALEGIMDSTLQVSHRVEEIAQTTAEQANTSNRVMKVTEQLTGSVSNIKDVSQEQSASGERLLEMSKQIQTAAEKMKSSTEEQTVTSQHINKDLTRISDTVRNISESTEMQTVNGNKVLKMSEDLTGVINSNRDSVQGLQNILSDLNERMTALRNELDLLKVEED